MSTAFANPNYYQPYSAIQANPTNVNLNTSDPRKIAGNVQQLVTQQGQQLYGQNNQQADQNQQYQGQTQAYLNNIEDPLAQGQGGYNASEVSNIEMTPQQQQNIVTGAGISAGVNTAAGDQAAQMAANASGGNPLALAAYRNRAAQQQGSQAATAETGARVGAQQALSGETQAVGNARLAQQNQGLGYYQQQNEQANQNVNQALNRNAQTYGTATSGETGAANTGLSASQTPSTFDKILGGVAGAASAFLEEGGMQNGDAVVGEGGNPERVVDTRYLDGGDGGDAGDSGWADLSGTPLGSDAPNNFGASAGAGGATQPGLPWWKRMLTSAQTTQPQQNSAPAAGGPHGNTWNTTTPYQQLGQIGGALAKNIIGYLEDGGIPPSYMADGFATAHYPPPPQGANGIFTQPTRVKLGPHDAVVPLTERAHPKVKPSMALMPAANASYYGRPHAQP